MIERCPCARGMRLLALFALASRLTNTYHCLKHAPAQRSRCSPYLFTPCHAPSTSASARQFIVLWELDAHCAGELDKVFNVPLDVILLNSSKNFRLFLQFSSVTSKFQAYVAVTTL